MQKNDGLPKAAYTDPRFFDLELRHIFSKTWAFAGLKEDVNNPGDFITVQAGLNNIIVIMGRDHRLRAFHNMCRHRGTQLLTAQGKDKKLLTCPYHDWTYDIEGQLISIPKQQQEFGEVNKQCLNLKAAKVDVWRGMIWVHADPEAEAITHWFNGIDPYLGPHKVEELIESKDSVVIENIQANWKLVVENYIDQYHLAQLHSGTLSMYDHAKAEFGFVGPHYLFWEPLVKEYADGLESKSLLPLIDNIPKEKLGAWVPMLFPNIGLGESESSWSVFHVIPIAVDKTKVVIRTKVMNSSSMSFLKQGVKSLGYWSSSIKAKYDDHSSKHPLGSADFMQEDIYVCEQQQKSLASPYFELGPSALKGEQPIRDFQKVVWRYIQPHWKTEE
ncbi:MAG: aromatic ring-hydroxylating oxygenase subunit alpha [Parashewanella sp.]